MTPAAAVRPFASLVACVLMLSGALLGGCQSTAKEKPVRGVSATYSYPTLSAVLPEGARVPSVLAAAEDTLRSRGYAIATSQTTEEAGKVIARPPRTSSYPTVTVRSERVEMGTRVMVSVSPIGDSDLSSSVLDGVLQRMGM